MFAIYLVLILFQYMPTAYCMDEQVEQLFNQVAETKNALDKLNEDCIVLTLKLHSFFLKSESKTLSLENLDEIAKYKQEMFEKNEARNHHLRILEELLEK